MSTVEILFIVFWAIVAIATLIVELSGPQLVSIWFTLGSIVALILASLRIQYWIQILAFLGVSALALAIIFPIYRKFFKKRQDQEKDINSKVGIISFLNADTNHLNISNVTLNDVVWEVVSDNFMKKDTKVKVVDVKGNKLYVKEELE